MVLDPRSERCSELTQELARALVLQLAARVEQIRSASDVGFRLLHHRDVQEHERLAQMMVCTESADCTRRHADHGAGLAVPYALSIGTRADVDRILQGRRHR